MSKVTMSEKPSCYSRDDDAIVIFPSRPYWFSASNEVIDILKAFNLGESSQIIEKIVSILSVSTIDAEVVYSDLKDLLYSSGVLAIDGEMAQAKEYSPNFQVNEVENVLVIATTQQCNMTCPMCYAMASQKMPSEMTTKQIKMVVDQLTKMPWQNGISRVALTGGELFTRQDALELIDYVHNQGFFVQVNTNATLLTKNQIAKLAEYSRLKMSISLDGCQKSTHEYIRGKDTFNLTVENIRALCQSGVSVAINMFVHAENIDDMKGTMILADSLGVEGFNCLNMMHVGRGNSKKTKQLLIPVPLATFYRKVFEAIRNEPRLQELMMCSTFANQIMGIAGGVKSYSCGIGTNRAVYVKADGTLYPCADTALQDFKLGNLLDTNLADIWETSSILKELRTLNIDSLNPKCSACDVRYLCAGNCRGENYQTTGELKSPHFKCEEIHDSILELMWILTEEPDLFKCKVNQLYATVNSHATTA